VILIPSEPGSYVLELSTTEPLHLQIGRLGDFYFPAGDYIYAGSALGPGGLHARLSWHLDSPPMRSPRWHIDYLRQHAAPVAVCFLAHKPLHPQIRLECVWCDLLFTLPMSYVPVPGFGASDCPSTCSAHLVGFRHAGKSPVLSDVELRRELARSAFMPEGSLRFQLLLPEVK
jgi:Uri superfamily endonuclease